MANKLNAITTLSQKKQDAARSIGKRHLASQLEDKEEEYAKIAKFTPQDYKNVADHLDPRTREVLVNIVVSDPVLAAEISPASISTSTSTSTSSKPASHPVVWQSH